MKSGTALRSVVRVRVLPTMVFAILLVVTSLTYESVGQAGTPFSTPKSCGYQGGPACPSTAVDISPWLYFNIGPGPTTPYLASVGDVLSLIVAYETGPQTCSIVASTPGLINPPAPLAQYGITFQEYYGSTLTIHSNPQPPYNCNTVGNVNAQIEAFRTFSCPPYYTWVYTTNPLIGPYCTYPSAQPIPPKQTGCPSCDHAFSSGGANAGSGGLPKGDPVDVSNGNLNETETDYSGAGNNPIKFVRTYNSLGATCEPTSGSPTPGQSMYLGGGWSATYFQYLLPVSITDSHTTYNTVYAYRPDGRILTFNQYNGVYSPDGDVSDSLVQTSSGWSYQTADDTIETYNSSGQLLSVAKRGQAPVTVNYASGTGFGDPPISVSDAFGHSLQFSYTSSNIQLLKSITDPAGNTVSYTHDSTHNRLTVVTQTDNTTRTYGYSSGYSTACYLTSITDENSVQYVSWSYNGSNQPATSQNAGGVNSYTFTYSESGSSGSVTVTDPLGKVRTNNQSLIWGAYRTTSSSAPCPGCSEDAGRVYDASGNITSRTDYNGNQTTYVYNAQTNLETSRTEAYGTSQARTITTQWDTSWRQPSLITEPSRTTAFAYDGDQGISCGGATGSLCSKTITDTTVTPNVTRTWTYTYDSYGRMLTAKGPRTDVNSTTTYTYYTCTAGSQCGQLNTVTDPEGNVTTYNSYNAHGQPTQITDPNGIVTTLAYDLRLRLTDRCSNGSLPACSGGELTHFDYYPTALLKKVTLPDSSYVLYTYDNAHRLTQISDGAGNSIQYTLDNMENRTAEKTYDPSNNLHRTHTRAYNALNELYQDVNAAGTSAVTTTYGYDNNGNQTTINAPVSRNTTNVYDPLNRLSQITDPNSGNTYFGYDGEDNLTSVKDPRSLTTNYAYNGFGDLTQQVSPDTGTTQNTYDSGGNLSTATDARNAVASYGYDKGNRVTSITYKYNGVADQTITFGYDSGTNGKGRLTSASDANHSLSWTYDTHGRVTGKGLTIGSVNKSVGYGYTNADLTSIVTPSGQSVVYGYNTNHQVTSITVNGTTVLSGMTYEPFGGANGWTWGNGSTVSRTYNGDGLVSQIVTASVTLGYSFDNANRVTGISDSSNSALTWTYGYDPLDRLTSGTTSAITDGWTYDANGNRLTQIGTTAITFSVSSTDNQLTATTGGLVRSYSYDAAGNTEGYGSYTFSYNNRGRMKSTSASSTSYLYNALGQMVEKSGTLGTTIFMQDEAGHLIGEYDGSGNLIQETIWLGDIPVATLRPNGSSVNIFYVHTDHLNAPRKVSRPSDNTLEWRWDADPFGTAAPNQNPAGLGTFIYGLRFPGQYYMAETGLNQNYYRDYDAQVGRYLEVDPIGLTPASYSSYAYGDDDPVSKIDPTGQQAAPEVPGAIITAAVFCEKYPRICGEISQCFRNPESCRRKFCSLGRVLYKADCSVPGCLPCDTCATALFKAAAAETCVFLRQAARTICKGTDRTTSGENHEAEIQKAQNKFAKCAGIAAQACANTATSGSGR
jgi:RHS repeat-associated protein